MRTGINVDTHREIDIKTGKHEESKLKRQKAEQVSLYMRFRQSGYGAHFTCLQKFAQKCLKLSVPLFTAKIAPFGPI